MVSYNVFIDTRVYHYIRTRWWSRESDFAQLDAVGTRAFMAHELAKRKYDESYAASSEHGLNDAGPGDFSISIVN